MKAIFTLLIATTSLVSCNSQSGSTEEGKDPTSTISADSINKPGGVINSSPISTDTAAMNVQNAERAAADSAR